MPRNAVKILHRGSRRVTAGITSVVATSLMGHAVAADDGSDYPKKPVRMLVPLGAGGGVDVLARLIAQKLGDAWGQRAPVLPEVPTRTELGVTGGEIIAWAAVVGPKGTPKSTVDKTSEGIARALRDPQLRDKVLSAGMAPVDDSTPETFAAFLRQEVQRWRQRVDDAGLKPE